MSNMPAVIVRKGNFLSALFHGLFGFLAVAVICVSLVGLYGLHVVDGQVSWLLGMGKSAVAGLPGWQQNLPLTLSEILDSRRAVDYRAQVEVSARTVRSPRGADRELTVIEVVNNGSETITVLALNVVLEDESGVPLHEFTSYAATPLACDKFTWRGPLLPGSTRKFARRCYSHERGLKATVEVAELHVWNGPQETDAGTTVSAELGGSTDGHATAPARQVATARR